MCIRDRLKQIRNEKLDQNLNRDLKRFLATSQVKDQGFQAEVGAVKAEQGELSTAHKMAGTSMTTKGQQAGHAVDVAETNRKMKMDTAKARRDERRGRLDEVGKLLDINEAVREGRDNDLKGAIQAAEMSGIDISGLPESLQAWYYNKQDVEFEGKTAFNLRMKDDAKKNIDALWKAQKRWDVGRDMTFDDLTPEQQAEKMKQYRKEIRDEENRLALAETGESDLIEQQLNAIRSGEIPDDVSRETMPGMEMPGAGLTPPQENVDLWWDKLPSYQKHKLYNEMPREEYMALWDRIKEAKRQRKLSGELSGRRDDAIQDYLRKKDAVIRKERLASGVLTRTGSRY